MQVCINGKMYTGDFDPTLRLIDFLRDEIGLTGTKEGCAEGECGACTVIMNGRAVASCLVAVGQIDGAEILTIEGVGTDDTLSALQRAFVAKGAVQCGFCTPGMIMSAKALLADNPNPSRAEIEIAISGNLCRCTGYGKIVEAIEAVVKGEFR